MTDRLSELEARLEALAEGQRALAERVARLERRAPAARAAAPAAPDVSLADLRTDAAAVSRNLALAGRTLLVLAGAFLLRAVTDAGTIPAWLGVSLGFAYAGAWVAMAWRSGAAQAWSAGFHGLSAILVGYPLLVEATTRFRLLGPASASALLAALSAVALAVAATRRLQALAWLVEVGGIAAAVALMIATGRLAPPLLFLAAVGVAALWLGYVRDWFYLRWPIALAVDVALVLLALQAVAHGSGQEPGSAVAVQLVVVAAYLASFAARTLVLQRPVVDFEGVQTALLLVVGLGGAAWVTAQSGHGGAALGAASALLGAAGYAVAFAFLDRRHKSTTNFYFYSTVALVLALLGTGLVLGGWAGAGWALLAAASAAGARVLRRLTLVAHAAVFAGAAAVAGDLLDHAGVALLASPLSPWPALPVPGWMALAAAGAAAALTARMAPAAARERTARCALLAIAAIGAAGALAGLLVPALAGSPGPRASAGVAATVRTAVLVAGTLLLAWAGRRDTWREAGWLAWPALVVTGLKLLLEDVPRSAPASLFLAFGLYGAALILVPRLRRRPEADARPAAGGRSAA
jgi:hypothetical protein